MEDVDLPEGAQWGQTQRGHKCPQHRRVNRGAALHGAALMFEGHLWDRMLSPCEASKETLKVPSEHFMGLAEVGWDLWKSPGPTLKQGHLEPVHGGPPPGGCWVSLTTSLGDLRLFAGVGLSLCSLGGPRFLTMTGWVCR